MVDMRIIVSDDKRDTGKQLSPVKEQAGAGRGGL